MKMRGSGGGNSLGEGEIPHLPKAEKQGAGASVGICRREGRGGGDQARGPRSGMPGRTRRRNFRRGSFCRSHARISRPHRAPHALFLRDREWLPAAFGTQ